MSLPLYRQQLLQALPSTGRSHVNTILNCIDNWWHAYKEWERQDTFENAFDAGRMTVRTIKYKTVHTPLSMTRMTAPQLGKQEIANTKSDTGIKGMMLRMDPTNFVKPGTGESSKYEHGLFDMSSSLLHPERLIVHQLYGWGFQTDSHAQTTDSSTYVVFMPVAQMADMALFAALNRVAKVVRTSTPQIYEEVRRIRSEMTRIKYADKDDSHIGFVDISTKDSPRPKFRYGLKNSDALANNVDSESLRQRAYDAKHYTSILETAHQRALRTGKAPSVKFYNEITVAYRKHASPLFPLFTRWANGNFQVMRNTGTGMVDDLGKTVSNNGRTQGL
jgi:hypothetical protein